MRLVVGHAVNGRLHVVGRNGKRLCEGLALDHRADDACTGGHGKAPARLEPSAQKTRLAAIFGLANNGEQAQRHFAALRLAYHGFRVITLRLAGVGEVRNDRQQRVGIARNPLVKIRLIHIGGANQRTLCRLVKYVSSVPHSFPSHSTENLDLQIIMSRLRIEAN